MSVFVLGKESRGASIVLPSWSLWVLFYWLIMWAIFLEWYSRGVKSGERPKMNWLVLLFTFLFIGFLPPLLIVFSILKGVAKTKR